MTEITDQQYDSLVKGITDLLMSSPEMGMGEMGDCRDAAINVVDEWMEANKIILSEEIDGDFDKHDPDFTFPDRSKGEISELHEFKPQKNEPA